MSFDYTKALPSSISADDGSEFKVSGKGCSLTPGTKYISATNNKIHLSFNNVTITAPDNKSKNLTNVYS